MQQRGAVSAPRIRPQGHAGVPSCQPDCLHSKSRFSAKFLRRPRSVREMSPGVMVQRPSPTRQNKLRSKHSAAKQPPTPMLSLAYIHRWTAQDFNADLRGAVLPLGNTVGQSSTHRTLSVFSNPTSRCGSNGLGSGASEAYNSRSPRAGTLGRINALAAPNVPQAGFCVRIRRHRTAGRPRRDRANGEEQARPHRSGAARCLQRGGLRLHPGRHADPSIAGLAGRQQSQQGIGSAHPCRAADMKVGTPLSQAFARCGGFSLRSTSYRCWPTDVPGNGHRARLLHDLPETGPLDPKKALGPADLPVRSHHPRGGAGRVSGDLRHIRVRAVTRNDGIRVAGLDAAVGTHRRLGAGQRTGAPSRSSSIRRGKRPEPSASRQHSRTPSVYRFDGIQTALSPEPEPAAPGPRRSERPTPGFANFLLFVPPSHVRSSVSSIYHSRAFSVERRRQKGIGIQTANTWAKTIDDVSAFLGSAGD